MGFNTLLLLTCSTTVAVPGIANALFTIATTTARGVDPYWTGGSYPPIFMKGDIHGNVPQYFRSDVV